MGIKIEIQTEIYPTEDVEKIKRAFLLLFPDVKLSVLPGKLVGEARSMEEFAKVLREERIRDAARAVFLSSLKKYGTIEFELNKQAATVGKVSFSVGNVPLGNIRVRITGESLDSLIDSVAPDTRKGQ